MKLTTGWIVGAVVVAVLVAVSLPAAAQQTLYYQGHFDGEVKHLDRGVGWYQYKPAQYSAYPLLEYRHTSPWWYLIGPDDEKDKDESFLNPNKQKVHTLRPLPGQYWFNKPFHYNSSIGADVLGWPYRKYNTRYW